MMFSFLTLSEQVITTDNKGIWIIFLIATIIYGSAFLNNRKTSYTKSNQPLEKYDFGCKTPEELDAYKRQLEKEWKEKCRKNGRK